MKSFASVFFTCALIFITPDFAHTSTSIETDLVKTGDIFVTSEVIPKGSEVRIKVDEITKQIGGRIYLYQIKDHDFRVNHRNPSRRRIMEWSKNEMEEGEILKYTTLEKMHVGIGPGSDYRRGTADWDGQQYFLTFQTIMENKWELRVKFVKDEF